VIYHKMNQNDLYWCPSADSPLHFGAIALGQQVRMRFRLPTVAIPKLRRFAPQLRIRPRRYMKLPQGE